MNGSVKQVDTPQFEVSTFNRESVRPGYGPGGNQASVRAKGLVEKL